MSRHHHHRLDPGRLARFRHEVLEAADRRCQRCESPLNLEAHHVVPVSAGGAPYDPANGAAMCADCHIDLHEVDRDRADWRRYVRISR